MVIYILHSIVLGLLLYSESAMVEGTSFLQRPNSEFVCV